MQAFESAPDPATQVRQIQERIAELENASSSVLRTRLARAHPWHITRIARGFFLGLTVLSAIVVAGSLVIVPNIPEAARFLAGVDDSLPLPFPLLALILTLCMAVAWLTAGQAAVAIGRDCPLLPWEQQEKAKLQGQLMALADSGAFITSQPDDRPPPLQMPQARLQSSTPSYLKPRVAPTPPSTPGGTLQYESVRDPHSGAGTPAPVFGTPRPASRTPRPAAGTPRPASYASPRPALRTPRPGTPAPPPRQASAGSLSYRGPEPGTTPAPAPAGGDPIRYDRRPSSGYTIGPESAVDPISADLSAGTASWRGPSFQPVDEPWLQDALRKAEELGRRYPVQAFLEYSVEPDLPFTLVLERATPAMAVRAMVDFVGFIASIATPRRARIELRSVVHLDRSFYRSVMSAMEPYFPDTVDIRQQGYRVEITFLDPDPNWARYPILPLDE